LFTQIRAVVVAVLLCALLLTSASPVAALGYLGILAGRPISGDAQGSCQGTAYGKVGGLLVLFTAWHCRNGRTDGSNVIGPDGGVIGYLGFYHQGNSHDVDYIVIQDYPHPTSGLNTIYRGNPGYTPYYWTITGNPYSLGCPDIGGTGAVPWGSTVLQDFNPTITSTWSFTSSTTVAFEKYLVTGTYPNVECTVETTQSPITGYGTAGASGGSEILAGHATVWGIASGWWDKNGNGTGPDSSDGTVTTPMREGLLALNYQTATRLCYTSTCS
jgi:hypothetical protein